VAKEKMKRLGIILGVLFITCAILSGCSKESEKTVAESIDMKVETQKMADYIVEKTEFADFMSLVDFEIFLSLYNLDESIVKDASMYASTGATAEEVAVIIPYDEAELELIQVACEERIEAQKDGFKNYIPEELVKLENPVMKRVGDAFIFVVCNDKDKAEELINNYSNTEI
jgi:hypothetical protein